MADRRPALVSFYRLVAGALEPFFYLLFSLRERSGKEIGKRRGERFGSASLERPEGSLVWIHAASVGETTSVLSLVHALVARGHKVLLTTITVTASEIAEKQLPKGAVHQFAPYDSPRFVARFLDHWQPDLAIVVESEIWPCAFDAVHRRSIPFVLVNGRLSEKSCRNWSKAPESSAYVFSCLSKVLAQSETDAERFAKLGCVGVETPGNLKFDARVQDADPDEVQRVKDMIGDRPVWLAALTHPEEDDIALQAHAQLQKQHENLLMIMVPRHPVRADEIAGLIGAKGFDCARRSQNEPLTETTDVYLGDTLGEMGLFYRLAPVTFLGGSFNTAGGHNPVEAALIGSALVTGPNVANARSTYKELWERNAARRVDDSATLASHISELIEFPDRARKQAHDAEQIVMASRGAVERTVALLEPYLTKEEEHGKGT